MSSLSLDVGKKPFELMETYVTQPVFKDDGRFVLD